MNKLKKNGVIFMTDLLITLSIVIFLSSVSIVAGNSLIKKSKITSLGKEISTYKNAISDFYDLYKYYPGDLNITSSDAKNFPSNIVSNALLISNSCSGSTKCTYESGHVTGLKSSNSFLQLSSSNSIDSNLVNQSYQIQSSGGCIATTSENFSSMSGVLFPKSKSITGSIFVFSVDNKKSSEFISPQSSSIYSSSLYDIYSSIPRLILLNPSQYQQSPSCEVYTNLSSSLLGSLNGNMAYQVDKKFDDGNPYSGNIIGDNASSEGSEFCVQSSSYSDSSTNDSSRMCVMTFFI